MADLKENIYLILKDAYERDIAPTDRYIESKLDSSCLENMQEINIAVILNNDEKIISINESQYILQESLEKDAQELDSEEELFDLLKNKYFIMNIKEEKIRNILKSNPAPEDDYIEKYNSRNKKYEMFINEVTSKGYISYQDLQKNSEYYNKEYDDICIELNDRGIEFIDEKEEKPTEKQLSKMMTELDEIYSRQEKSPIEKGLKEHRMKDEDILLTDLRVNEFISGIFLITYIDHNYQGHVTMTSKHFKEMNRFRFITKNKQDINLTELGKELSERFNDYIKNEYHEKFLIEVLNKYKTTRELSKDENVKKIARDSKVWNSIRGPMQKVYMENRVSKVFLEFLKEANKEKCFSMKRLFLFAINNNYDYVLNNILIGDKATSGLKPIEERTDICFHCPFDRCEKSQIDLQDNLLHYRNHYVNKIIEKYRGTKEIGEIIKRDPMLIKFMVPYNFVVSTKIFLERLNMIKKDKVYYKDSGIYCINRDRWEIKYD